MKLERMPTFSFVGDDRCAFCGGQVVGVRSFNGEVTEYDIECKECGSQPCDEAPPNWVWDIDAGCIDELRPDLQDDARAAMKESGIEA